MKRIQKFNTMKTTRLYTLFALLMVFAVSCNKPDEPNNGGNNGGGNNNDVIIAVTTTTPSEITTTTAMCGAEVTTSSEANLSELGVCWSTQFNPTASDDHLSSTTWNKPFTCIITGLEPNTTYYVCAYVKCNGSYYYGDIEDFITEKEDEVLWIDLGLPSGLLWATRNVGADKPEDYGDFFAWGETSAKLRYAWGTYKYSNGIYSKLTKYCTDSTFGCNGFVDNLVVLDALDDAATVNWGNNWRIPTTDEWVELFENTTNTWIAQEGVYGRLFMSSNDQSIFLPAAGSMIAIDNSYSDYCGAGNYGGYWSNSLYDSNPNHSWNINFNQDDSYWIHYILRCDGLSVRPVRSSE
jgi:uncharacterized protein (TIGR02145 family)